MAKVRTKGLATKITLRIEKSNLLYSDWHYAILVE